MNNISLSSLLNTNLNNNMSIENLITSEDIPTDKKVTNIKNIVDLKNKSTQEKMKVYEIYYSNCLDEIEKNIKLNKNYFIYYVPKYSNLHSGYNYLECTTYITQKLEKEEFCVTTNDNQIFISIKLGFLLFQQG